MAYDCIQLICHFCGIKVFEIVLQNLHMRGRVFENSTYNNDIRLRNFAVNNISIGGTPQIDGIRQNLIDCCKHFSKNTAFQFNRIYLQNNF